MEELVKELYEKLSTKNLEDGIKEVFIKEEKDYFKQAVIIMSNVPESEENDKLITDIDIIFMNHGYKPYDFVNAIVEYKKELEELYQKMREVK